MSRHSQSSEANLPICQQIYAINLREIKYFLELLPDAVFEK